MAPSSRRLAEKMVADIDFEHAEYIVEYGPGTGVFTDRLVEKKKPDTVLLLLEANDKFYELLREKYESDHRIIVVHGFAEHIDLYLKKYGISKVDYVVSGLPFTSLPKNTSETILKKTSSLLDRNGTFITFQYTLMKESFIAGFFQKTERERVLLNIPPAYVLKCKC